MTALTPADLDNLTALAEAATAGDWRTWNDGHVGSPDVRIGGIFMPTEGSDPAQWMHDARFTAATDPPTVLALVAALQEAHDELESSRRTWRKALDLTVAERDEARALVAAGLALADHEDEHAGHTWRGDKIVGLVSTDSLRAALTTPTEEAL